MPIHICMGCIRVIDDDGSDEGFHGGLTPPSGFVYEQAVCLRLIETIDIEIPFNDI